MDRQLVRPSVPTEERAIDELESTAKSLALAARKAGYRVVAVVSESDDGSEVVTVGGRMFDWGFTARWRARRGWEVRIRRPGWPEQAGNVVALRSMFTAQTPHDLGKVR